MSRERDLSLKETADQLNVNEETARQLACRGLLRGAYKSGLGGRTSPWRVPPKALDHYRALQPQGYRA